VSFTNSPRPSDEWSKSPTALLESYCDSNFRGDKIARDESIEFLSGEIKLKAFLAAVANLSKDTKAFETAMNDKKMNFSVLSQKQPPQVDHELGYLQELQARLKVLTLLQIGAVHKNLNIPNRNKYLGLIEQTSDSLFEIALTLGEESTIRIIAKQLFDRMQNDSNKKALLLRLNRLYPMSERVTETVLELMVRDNFDCGDPLDLLEEFYGENFSFDRLLVTEVLGNFESFLPRHFNDLDQAMLLRFIAPRMKQEHVDDVYDRFLKLDIRGDEELECLILDRIAILKNDQASSNADVLTATFREQLDRIDTVPIDWGLEK